MTSDEQLELNRLCGILGALENSTKDRTGSEALKKAAIALSVAYIHGYKSEIENLYSSLNEPLSDSQKEHIVRLGINPEE